MFSKQQTENVNVEELFFIASLAVRGLLHRFI